MEALSCAYFALDGVQRYNQKLIKKLRKLFFPKGWGEIKI